jgi:acyl-CoA reductase-like NAD-dependent aldehyde dehydrogenase
MTVLETFKQLSGAIHLDGAIRKSASTEGFDGIDPATEEVTGELAYARIEEVDEAVEIARRAQREWNRMNMLKRSELLHEVAHKFRHNVGKLAEALTREIVGFVQKLRGMDLFKLPGVAETIDWTQALMQLDALVLDPRTIDNTLGVLLKYQDDIARIQGSEAARILDQVRAEVAARR